MIVFVVVSSFIFAKYYELRNLLTKGKNDKTRQDQDLIAVFALLGQCHCKRTPALVLAAANFGAAFENVKLTPWRLRTRFEKGCLSKTRVFQDEVLPYSFKNEVTDTTCLQRWTAPLNKAHVSNRASPSSGCSSQRACRFAFSRFATTDVRQPQKATNLFFVGSVSLFEWISETWGPSTQCHQSPLSR